MNDVIIEVEHLSKRYRLRHQAESHRYVALRDVITEKAKALFRRNAAAKKGATTIEDFWALQDVSFQIKQGEVVGIIGRNGAGKSTLLKILSRITEPTEGRVCLRGRVGSLLEVGTGFHPELTGRENIYLNGAILGMTKAEVRRNFDAIVAFAEVDRFLDTPVKHYSSGMYVRLAFAVAAHLEPEILVVDEVLAVGDAEFQKKCLGKMSEVSRTQGRTVLFVSHNINAVTVLCTRAIVLQKGKVLYLGNVAEAVARYGNSTQVSGSVNFAENRKGSLLRSLQITQAGAGTSGLLEPERDVIMEFNLETPRPLNKSRLGVGFTNLKGDRIFAVGSWLGPGALPRLSGAKTIRLVFAMPPVVPGRYTLDVGFYDHEGDVFEEFYSIGTVEVPENNFLRTTQTTGPEVGQIYVRSQCFVV